MQHYEIAHCLVRSNESPADPSLQRLANAWYKCTVDDCGTKLLDPVLVREHQIFGHPEISFDFKWRLVGEVFEYDHAPAWEPSRLGCCKHTVWFTAGQTPCLSCRESNSLCGSVKSHCDESARIDVRYCIRTNSCP